MKQKKKKFYFTRIGLLVTGLVFLLLLLTHFVSNSIFMLIHRNSLPPMRPGNPLYPMLFQNACFSIISGTLLTFLLSHFPLRPIHSIIQAIHDVAEGRFDTKLHIEHPREFRELSHSFNQMTAELGSTEMMRNDFINTFSHEFKTPIVSIRGFAKRLRNENLPLEKREKYLEYIAAESERLSDLASSVLLIARYENQKLVTEQSEYDLDEQIRGCVLRMETLWSAKELTFEMDLPKLPYVNNVEMMEHVWMNLISNAIKFSHDGGQIFISAVRAADSIAVTIRDEGIGISQADIGHIFDKFYQSDTAHSSVGNGLGLPLVHRIVQLSGGAIAVKSEVGKGTEFTVTLPAAHT